MPARIRTAQREEILGCADLERLDRWCCEPAWPYRQTRSCQLADFQFLDAHSIAVGPPCRHGLLYTASRWDVPGWTDHDGISGEADRAVGHHAAQSRCDQTGVGRLAERFAETPVHLGRQPGGRAVKVCPAGRPATTGPPAGCG
jgi:hypothetical protein